MKEIKYLLNALFWVVYTSSWWAAARWFTSFTINGWLYIIPGILTIIICIAILRYCIYNWDDK